MTTPGRDDDSPFDPLLSDEPIDLNAIQADDALITALSDDDSAALLALADTDPDLFDALRGIKESGGQERP